MFCKGCLSLRPSTLLPPLVIRANVFNLPHLFYATHPTWNHFAELKIVLFYFPPHLHPSPLDVYPPNTQHHNNNDDGACRNIQCRALVHQPSHDDLQPTRKRICLVTRSCTKIKLKQILRHTKSMNRRRTVCCRWANNRTREKVNCVDFCRSLQVDAAAGGWCGDSTICRCAMMCIRMPSVVVG